MENTSKLIRFSKKHIEMADRIKTERGYMSFSAVIHQALVESYLKNFPSYAEKGAGRLTPEEKIANKRKEKELKIKEFEDAQLSICTDLGGELVEQDGSKLCVYFTYNNKKRYRQSIPLRMLSADFLKNQYQPTKEKVLRLQKEGKVDY